jgi:hypothetical protein
MCYSSDVQYRLFRTGGFPTYPEAVFKEKHGVWGPYAKVDYKSSYHIVSSVVSYLPPLHRERGGIGKSSPIG